MIPLTYSDIPSPFFLLFKPSTNQRLPFSFKFSPFAPSSSPFFFYNTDRWNLWRRLTRPRGRRGRSLFSRGPDTLPRSIQWATPRCLTPLRLKVVTFFRFRPFLLQSLSTYTSRRFSRPRGRRGRSLCSWGSDISTIPIQRAAPRRPPSPQSKVTKCDFYYINEHEISLSPRA